MNELIPIEREGLRVLLTSQLAEAYETTTDTITKNFNRNKERYQEGKHFFMLEGEALKEFKTTTQFDLSSNLTKGQFVPSSIRINKLYLWTEKGALLHAKSLNTDKAWEVYDHLVETYFRAKRAITDVAQFSSQLQVLMNLELEQKRQAAALQAVEQKVDGIRDVVSLDSQAWREDCRKLLARVAQARGGGGAYQEVNNECFSLIDRRVGVSLETRLTNKRRRMAEEGVCKSRRDKLTKVDVIADDKKLIEIYLAIVKEMTVKYGVT